MVPRLTKFVGSNGCGCIVVGASVGLQLAAEPTGQKHVALRRGVQQEDTPMRTMALAIVAGTLLATTQANAGTFPVNALNGMETSLVDTVAVRVYVHEGRRYCFYFEGWHGPGWYRCGFAWRRGIGWGGVYGWNSWTYGPYEQRHHHHRRHGEVHHRGDRMSIDSGSTRGRSGIETRSRSRATTGVESNTRVRSTTGRGPGADVQGGGRVRMHDGGNGGPSGRGNGGADAGGGAGMERK
jgi:hypothetical protein